MVVEPVALKLADNCFATLCSTEKWKIGKKQENDWYCCLKLLLKNTLSESMCAKIEITLSSNKLVILNYFSQILYLLIEDLYSKIQDE